MITDELKALVKQEADNLKKFASEEELGRLDFSKMNPDLSKMCIYGQMNYSCYSDRATELLNLCAMPYSDDIDRNLQSRSASFKDSRFRAFSPIEFYISQKDAKNENLINYLKGVTNTLDL
jgi:hypothetical protein